MASTKAKTASTSGAGKKQKPAATPSTTNGSVTPAAPSPVPSEPTSYGSGRPDKKIYDVEQQRIQAEIDGVQVKLVSCLGCSASDIWLTLRLLLSLQLRRRFLSPRRVVLATKDGMNSVLSWTLYVASSRQINLIVARSSTSSKISKMVFRRR